MAQGSSRTEKETGEARDLMDRITAAVTTGKDAKAAGQCYAADAVAVTLDLGSGGGNRLASTSDSSSMGSRVSSSSRFSSIECGDVAIDEGYIIGTNTGPLPGPSGGSIPATGRQVRVRSCDVVTVKGGLITQHRFYYDQMEFLDQLGLLPQGGNFTVD